MKRRRHWEVNRKTVYQTSLMYVSKALITALISLWYSSVQFSHSAVSGSATPWTAAHQASLSLGFSRQEHWSELPFPSPMHESEKWKWSRSVMSDSLQPHGLQPTRLFGPWDFPGKSTGVGCHQRWFWGNTVLCLMGESLMFLLKTHQQRNKHRNESWGICGRLNSTGSWIMYTVHSRNGAALEIYYV